MSNPHLQCLSKSLPELQIVMPVYNEEGAIAKVLEEWTLTLEKMEINFAIHVYNDGSKDQTKNILDQLARVNPRIIVHDKKNSGHGPTILQGYRENSQSQWLFQVDSDDEMDPMSFCKLWNVRAQYDFLIGTRDGRLSPAPRRIISFISRKVIRLFYGPGIWDVNSPYRLMRVARFSRLFEKIPSDTFAPNLILTGYACAQKMRIFETLIQHRHRRTGTVSIRKWKLLKSAILAFRQTILFSLSGYPKGLHSNLQPRESSSSEA